MGCSLEEAGAHTFSNGGPPVEVDGEVVVEPLRYTVSNADEPLPKSGGLDSPELVGGATLLLGAMLLTGALLVKRF